ncbi:MAG: glycine oxidase ThiO [Alphaproteobacteria bacterium]|nr:glycine oxidase ThiO [Alphaproteobacteria bacterium]
MSLKISIIGGGVAGLCVARELVDRGADITLYERGDGVGKHACSWWAGGMLAPYCEGETAEDIVVQLGLKAADWWQKSVKKGIKSGQKGAEKAQKVQKNGTLVVSLARDHADLERFTRRTRCFTRVGADEIGRLEPDLKDRFSKGLFFESEAHLSPREVMTTLRELLVFEGVKFIRDEVEPELIAKDGLTIDCRGLAAKDSLADLRGVKGEMLMLSCLDVSISRPIRLLHPRIPIYIVPRGDGIYMLGATMIESSGGKYATARSVLELLSAAYALNPAFGEAEILEIGVDSRPAYPDNIPRLTRDGNIISINGLYRHGFLLAPAMAQMVAAHIFENKSLEMKHEYSA